MSDDRAASGPRSIAQAVARVTKVPLGKRGFAEGGMIADWGSIVGEAVSRFAQPLKIQYPPGERGDGTLHIRVASGAMATQLQHLEPLLIQRINGYFGYKAVARIAYTQGPLPKRPERKVPPPPVLPPAREQQLQDQLSGVEDPELKDMLARLGRHLLARAN